MTSRGEQGFGSTGFGGHSADNDVNSSVGAVGGTVVSKSNSGSNSSSSDEDTNKQ